MKTINQPTKAKLSHLNDLGEITVEFADRCAEYRDAGDLIKSSWVKTLRRESDDSVMPHTAHLIDIKKIDGIFFLILN